MGTIDLLLVTLEASRRLGLEDFKGQQPALERVATYVTSRETGAKNSSSFSATCLSQLVWLLAPLGPVSDAIGGALKNIPERLRSRSSELKGPEIALLIGAMRKVAARDAPLLEKLIAQLKVEGAHAGMSATDLVEVSEGLSELFQSDPEALRPLGQELLRRRQELTPDESHRVHAAFQAMKLPLPEVWTKAGAYKKRDGSAIVTTQAFVPQDGHEKKRRGNHDLERVSPPRVVRDYKMCSY